MVKSKSTKELLEKWSPLLEDRNLPAIRDPYRKATIAILLENQEKALKEAEPVNMTTGMQTYDPVLMGMIRRSYAAMIGPEICGVQPMTAPTGLIFALRAHYAPNGMQPFYDGTDWYVPVQDATSGKVTMTKVNGDDVTLETSEALFKEARVGYASTTSQDGIIAAGPDAANATGDTNPGSATKEEDYAVQFKKENMAEAKLAIGLGLPLGDTGTTYFTRTSQAGSQNLPVTCTNEPAGSNPDSAYAAVFPEYGSEGDINSHMAFTIEKVQVAARTFQLRTGYSIELAQDMAAVHGLNAQQECTNILTRELIAEQNRNILRSIYNVAKLGGEFNTNKGIFDFNTDSDGRWSNEKFKGLLFAIMRDVNAIGVDIRSGTGNILVCSPDVASALAAAGILDYAPALANMEAVGGSDFTQNAFAGVILGGRVKVYIDLYARMDFYMVGYKGASPYDAGFFFCPYVGAEILTATDPGSFQPMIAIKQRYGTAYNPLGGSDKLHQNGYYRISVVENISGGASNATNP